jgi:DNA polymerase III epsilon subunit-like protein
MDFVALDFETANADMSSICQIGLADFKNGLLQEEWKTYIDPEDGSGPHCLDSLIAELSSEPVGYRKHQAASANG